MAAPPCSTHPDRAAEFRCTACGRRLCPDCVETGHRLFLCRHCRERAVPIDPEAPAATNAYARRRALDRPYGLRDALRYPFRGLGRYLVPVWAVWLTVGGLLGALGGLVAHALIALLLPGLLFEIVRTTAAGDDQLPDWPDYAEPFRRLAEIAQALGIGAVVAAPVWIAARFAGVSPLALLTGHPGAGGVALLLGALGVGLSLGVFAFGATGTHESGWLWFRLDLHLEALLSKAGPQGLATVGLVLLLTATRILLGALLTPLPWVGPLIHHALGGYALVLSAHFVGLLFRRQRETLDEIYRD